MTVTHETLSFERTFAATPDALFEAYVNPRARELWSAPSPTAEVRIDSSDVRTGGQELGRCGTKGDMKWATRTSYHLVVQNEFISFTEELWEGEQLLTIALVTLEITPTATGVQLNLTDQIVSLIGQDGITGHRQGYAQALDNLARSVQAPSVLS